MDLSRYKSNFLRPKKQAIKTLGAGRHNQINHCFHKDHRLIAGNAINRSQIYLLGFFRFTLVNGIKGIYLWFWSAALLMQLKAQCIKHNKSSKNLIFVYFAKLEK